MRGGGGAGEGTGGAQSGKDKRVCAHATARAYCCFHKHRRLFVVDKRISMSMGARRQRGGAREDERGGGEDGDTAGTKRAPSTASGVLVSPRRLLTGC